MSETILIGSVSGNATATVFFVAVSSAIGGVVYFLLTRPSTRRAELAAFGAARRPVALVTALLAGGAVLGALATTLAGFHGITLDETEMRLHYFGRRSVLIDRNHVRSVETRPGQRSTWWLHITTTDGLTFASQSARRDLVESARGRLTR